MKTSEKIYRENSYLTTLEANVISCEKKDEFYEVILDKTIFYPHMSGGQPKDEGTINNIKVIDVQEKEDEIIHVVKEPLTNKVQLKIDYDVRFDYMQQHSGQHILSFAFSKLFNGKTVGFHLSSDYTTIDIDKELTEEMIVQAETLSNKVVYENKRMISNTYTYEETKSLDLRKAPPKLDRLRIVSIEDYDSVACGGTHVGYTSEVGIIKVIKTEKHKLGTRVEFLCGQRALKDYINKNKALMDLSLLFTCRTDMLLDNINKLLEENKNLKANYNILNSQLNDLIANELINSAITKNNINYIFELQDKDIKDLRYICTKLIQENNNVCILASEKDNFCNIVVGQSKNLNLDIKHVFEKCKALINAKGGGSNYMLQATGSVLKAEECLLLAKELLF